MAIRKKPSETLRNVWEHPDDLSDTVTFDGRQVPRCNARLKWTDPPRRCSKIAMRGKPVCRTHGGASTGGPLRHGRYSEKLGPLNEAYRQFMEQADLKALEPGLAALDSWIEYQSELARNGDGVDFRKDALRMFGAVEDAITGGDAAQLKRSLDELGSHLRAGEKGLRSMARVMESIQRRQHHTERAMEIDLRSDQVINARALLAFLHMVVETVRRELPKDSDRVVNRITDAIMAAGGGLGLPTHEIERERDTVR